MKYQINQKFVDIAISEYHYYILISDKLVIMSLISKKVIESLSLSKGIGKPIEIYLENCSQTLFVYGTKGIQTLSLYDEGQGVWELFVDLKNFEKAYEVCKNINSPMQKSVAGLWAD